MNHEVPWTFAWLRALREPALVLDWTLDDWQRVVRLARRLRLLARLAESIARADILGLVPEQPRRHLLAEIRLSRHRTTATTWALLRVGETLADAPYPRVLLKGAAYIGQDLAIASGRMPSDLDMLVPRAHIAHAQARLVERGWEELELDAHDQIYYREWSHEVPPMRHPAHAVELDLHHDILPPLARTHVDIALLLARLQTCKWPGWSVLHPVDQVLHSAAHLFLDAEPRERVRDLVDLDGMLREFGRDDAFWAELPRRASELGLTRVLALAAHFITHWLATPIPHETQDVIRRNGPSALQRAWLLPVMSALLTPTEPDAGTSLRQDIAAKIVLMRYHWQRLPLRLLLPHLWHKWRARPAAIDVEAQAEAGPAPERVNAP